MLALENREKEIRTQREEPIWTGRTRHTTSSQTTEQHHGQLKDERITEFDIIAIQELWKNDTLNTTHHPCSQHFDLLYCDSPDTRTCTFISKRISNAKWTAVAHSLDLNTVTIEYGNSREEEVVYIHNIYNLPINTGESTIPLLRDILRQLVEDYYIVVGDFNLHYPLWGKGRKFNTRLLSGQPATTYRGFSDGALSQAPSRTMGGGGKPRSTSPLAPHSPRRGKSSAGSGT
ncbi:hypothetical protein DL95DRAFT_509971 [Leptodontidium sp. 2 PMI_412]|nr:hypothetical protein DL95DRAFT_509971 [Leptodontidium sp. 2 PMI_412]